MLLVKQLLQSVSQNDIGVVQAAVLLVKLVVSISLLVVLVDGGLLILIRLVLFSHTTYTRLIINKMEL